MEYQAFPQDEGLLTIYGIKYNRLIAGIWI
jgi:hypothetical protein